MKVKYILRVGLIPAAMLLGGARGGAAFRRAPRARNRELPFWFLCDPFLTLAIISRCAVEILISHYQKRRNFTEVLLFEPTLRSYRL
jgi:hypothetical protein